MDSEGFKRHLFMKLGPTYIIKLHAFNTKMHKTPPIFTADTYCHSYVNEMFAQLLQWAQED